jgi:hypothetical protein
MSLCTTGMPIAPKDPDWPPTSDNSEQPSQSTSAQKVLLTFLTVAAAIILYFLMPVVTAFGLRFALALWLAVGLKFNAVFFEILMVCGTVLIMIVPWTFMGWFLCSIWRSPKR